MTAIEKTCQFFESRGLSMTREMENYIRCGYAIFTPQAVLMARPINVDKGFQDWPLSGGDCWYVFWACGRGLEWFIKQAPEPKPYVAWHRWNDFAHGRLPEMRVYNWSRVTELVHSTLKNN